MNFLFHLIWIWLGLKSNTVEFFWKLLKITKWIILQRRQCRVILRNSENVLRLSGSFWLLILIGRLQLGLENFQENVLQHLSDLRKICSKSFVENILAHCIHMDMKVRWICIMWNTISSLKHKVDLYLYIWPAQPQRIWRKGGQHFSKSEIKLLFSEKSKAQGRFWVCNSEIGFLGPPSVSHTSTRFENSKTKFKFKWIVSWRWYFYQPCIVCPMLCQCGICFCLTFSRVDQIQRPANLLQLDTSFNFPCLPSLLLDS